MALKFVLIVTLLLVQHIGSNLVDDMSCANHVHDECKQCDFIEFLDEKKIWDKNWCSKLQACGECLAVPRCSSKFLRRFVSLLLTTMKVSKIKEICPDLQYGNLLLRNQGIEMCAGSGIQGYWYDECGQRCTCENGHTICVRIRKEFTQMPFDERRRFVDAYYKATTDPHYKNEFVILLNKHSEIPTDYLHHMPQIFLPWHRWYLVKIEDFLRQIDCRITAPYYDWSVRATHGTVWRTSDPTDVWSPGPQGIGGNGVSPSYCVKDGKFREGNWKMPKIKGGGCLKRDFDFTCRLYNAKIVKDMLKKSFKEFENDIREEMHSTFHDCVGGIMPDNYVASNAPEFVFHHGFMDKLWSTFQERGKKYKFAYYPSINYRMPFADLYPWQLLDNDNLPGDVRVKYQEMEKDENEYSIEIEIDEEEMEPSDEVVDDLSIVTK